MQIANQMFRQKSGNGSIVVKIAAMIAASPVRVINNSLEKA
jgi:hypothetical protein